LGLADGLAGIIGQSLGRRSYDITGRKTIEGSLSFFMISWAILMGLLLYNQSPISGLLMFQAALASLLLTVLEGVTGYGWDNLPVPLLAGLMIYILII
jgi:dolichol kinase